MFLPMSREEMHMRDWYYLDFLIVSGDAYVDHPSFGVAIIGRVLEDMGFKVGIIAQPDWKKLESFSVMGEPRIACLVSGGNIDSMLNHYTAAKKPRGEDSYSPGGVKGKRPDRATIVYANRLREVFRDKPIILGGIEASLRRFAHYDFWEDRVRGSILVDANADLLLYGMADRQIRAIAEILAKKGTLEDCRHIPGVCYLTKNLDHIKNYRLIPGFEEVTRDKKTFAHAFMMQYQEQNPFEGVTLVQPHGGNYLVQNRPAKPLSQPEMDSIYKLPFQRTYHPVYESQGGVPAIKEVEFSLVSHRGCFGGCSFCALTFHQGRIIQNRSVESIVAEAADFCESPNFKGYIHDVGGPTANFRHPACKKQATKGACKDRHCLHPEPCPNLTVDHKEYVRLLRTLRTLPKVKKVFVRSGIRFDYLLLDKNREFLRELCQHHVSGQLKVAPEHVSPEVLDLMAKPKHEVYQEFAHNYKEVNKKLGKEQYLVCYYISGHPGTTLKEAVKLAEYFRDQNYLPEQVQDFIPTPGSMSTCMYYTELDPRTMKKIYVAKSPKEKAMQRALMQYRLPQNYRLVKEALVITGREDLIGYGKKTLIRPTPPGTTEKTREATNNNFKGTPNLRKEKDKKTRKSR